MKIGVITTQYSPNYGALLQTFALQKYLGTIDKVKSVEVIDYYPPHADAFWDVYSKKKDLKNRIYNLYLFFHPQIVKARNKQFDIFRAFIDENIKCSKRYSVDSITETRDEYDAFICGSDQIWNLTRHDDPIWFLYFTKGWSDKIKFSYAPSVADEIPIQYSEHLREYIGNLDQISVRESRDAERLKELTGKEICHVCDPVFLLSEQQWENIIPVQKIKEPYILCYFISTGDYAPVVVKKLKEITGLNVLHVNVNARDRFNSKWNVRNCNPFEFISYIKNATYICTNSFHCTAFSLLFRKNFVVVPKNMANSRMESLMEKANIGNRFIYQNKLHSLTLPDLYVDYSKSNIDDWIQDSKEFIARGLRLNGEDS